MLSLLSTALLASALSANAQEPMEVQVYDLSALTYWNYDVMLKPILVFEQGRQAAYWSEGRNQLSGGQVLDAVSSLIEPFIESSGGDFRTLESSTEGDATRVIVRTSAVAHREIGRVYSELSTMLSGSTRLRITQLDPLATTELDGRTFVDGDELQTMASSAIRVFELNVPVGTYERAEQGRRVDLIAGYDVEIATKSFMHTPNLVHAFAGLRAGARCAPTSTGTWVLLALQSTELDGDVVTDMVPIGGRLLPENSDPVTVLDSLPHDDANFLLRSYALDFFLPDGMAAIVDSGWSLGGSAGQERFAIEVVESTAVATRTIELGGNEVRIELTESIEPTRFLLLGKGKHRLPFIPDAHGSGPEIQLRKSEAGAFGIADGRALGPWAVVRRGAKGGRAATSAIETDLIRRTPGTATGLRIESEAANGDSSWATVPLSEGRGALVSVGVASIFYGKADVEVATGSSVNEDSGFQETRGVLAWLRPVGLPGTDDQLLEYEAAVRFGAESRLMDLKNSELELGDTYSGRTAGRMPLKIDGPATDLLGSASAGAEVDSVGLRISALRP